ncbi:NGG1 interacting factor [Phlyctochytrium bullatum]|nr:NGG1 interacting factor [Phlyctochytrium bullatum]
MASELPSYLVSPFELDQKPPKAGPLATKVLKAVEAFAPMALAESWDNVGVLMDPAVARPNANKVLACIDLTEPVIQEVYRDKSIGLVLAYHPPIFSGLKRLTVSDERQFVANAMAAMGVAIVSPHTAIDNCAGGVNDWLAQAFKAIPGALSCVIAKKIPPAATAAAMGLASDPAAEVPRRVLSELMPTLKSDVAGSGRIVNFAEGGVGLETVLGAIKAHLKLEKVRVALPPGWTLQKAVRSVAICAGSGSSVLRDVPADVYWTGEMGHHDVLATLYRRTAVILCEHSNTERGYLAFMAKVLEKQGIEVAVSEADKEPLQVM